MCAAGVAASLAGCTKMDTAATTAAPAATEATAKEETKAEEKTETAAEPEVKLIGAHVNTVDSSYQAGFDAMKEKLEEQGEPALKEEAIRQILEEFLA